MALSQGPAYANPFAPILYALLDLTMIGVMGTYTQTNPP